MNCDTLIDQIEAIIQASHAAFQADAKTPGFKASEHEFYPVGGVCGEMLKLISRRHLVPEAELYAALMKTAEGFPAAFANAKIQESVESFTVMLAEQMPAEVETA